MNKMSIEKQAILLPLRFLCLKNRRRWGENKVRDLRFKYFRIYFLYLTEFMFETETVLWKMSGGIH